MNTYFRLILDSTGQADFANPVFNNLNLGDISPFTHAKIFIEACSITVKKDDGGNPPLEYAHDFLKVSVKNGLSANTLESAGAYANTSGVIEVLGTQYFDHQGLTHPIVKATKNKAADIMQDGAIFPISILQDNTLTLSIKYANGLDITQAPAPHTHYSIILGIQLI